MNSENLTWLAKASGTEEQRQILAPMLRSLSQEPAHKPRNLPGVRASGGRATFAGTSPLLILLSSPSVHIWARLKREFEVSLNCANKFQKKHLPLKLKPEEAQPCPKSL